MQEIVLELLKEMPREIEFLIFSYILVYCSGRQKILQTNCT